MIIQPADCEEDIGRQEDPGETGRRIAEEKMQAALASMTDGRDRWIITADTFIRHNGRNLGKPANRKQAEEYLQELSGKTHRVITGVALHSPLNGLTTSAYASTDVRFAELSEKTIQWYLETGEWTDAAGAYRIQGAGEALVFSINGSYSNVMGLPLNLIYGMMRDAGYPV